MPTPPARFTKQLPIMLEPSVYDRIREIAEERQVSYATVARELIDLGLIQLERQ